MTKEAFTSQLARLQRNWPDFYTVERARMLWMAVEKWGDYQFESACNIFIGDFHKPPVVRDFLRWKADRAEIVVSTPMIQGEVESCGHCDDGLHFRPRGLHRCICPAGTRQEKNMKLPVWNPTDRGEFG